MHHDPSTEGVGVSRHMPKLTTEGTMFMWACIQKVWNPEEPFLVCIGHRIPIPL